MSLFLFWIPSFALSSQAQDADPQESATRALWLLENKDHKDFPRTLDAYIRAEDDVFRLRTTLSELDLTPQQIGSSLLLELALIFELTGDLPGAADYYLSASQVLPDKSPLLDDTSINYARILYELGDDQRALTLLQDIPRTSSNAVDSLLLQSAIHRHQNGPQRAIEVLLPALDLQPEDARRPIVLLTLTALYTEIDDEQSALLHKTELLRLAPNSPEAAIVNRDGPVQYLLSPRRLFQLLGAPVANTTATPDAAPPITMRPEEGSTPPTETVSPQTRIQTGSFQDRENAQYMIKDLAEVGFRAFIEQTAIGDATYHRVFLDGNYTAEEAEKVLIKLKDSGFEGYLVKR